jgi:hypothetical protein
LPNLLAQEADRRRKKLIVDGILKARDANDGLKDGMVFNTRACKFDPTVLACTGAKTESCLSSPQVDAVKKVFAGPRNSQGSTPETAIRRTRRTSFAKSEVQPGCARWWHSGASPQTNHGGRA